MLPLFSNGDRLVIWHSQSPHKGDAIVFHESRPATANSPQHSNSYRSYVKRVMGVPGDTVTCWNTPYLLEGTEYYVLGDNASASTDSRTFGPVSTNQIIGIVILRYFPTIKWVSQRHKPMQFFASSNQ